jgi:hypothetical protein
VRREQLHTLRLNERLDSLIPHVHRLLEPAQDFFLPTHRRPTAVASDDAAGGGALADASGVVAAYLDVFSLPVGG